MAKDLTWPKFTWQKILIGKKNTWPKVYFTKIHLAKGPVGQSSLGQKSTWQ